MAVRNTGEFSQLYGSNGSPQRILTTDRDDGGASSVALDHTNVNLQSDKEQEQYEADSRGSNTARLEFVWLRDVFKRFAYKFK